MLLMRLALALPMLASQSLVEYRYTGNEAAKKPPVGKAFEEVTRNSAGR